MRSKSLRSWPNSAKYGEHRDDVARKLAEFSQISLKPTESSRNRRKFSRARSIPANIGQNVAAGRFPSKDGLLRLHESEHTTLPQEGASAHARARSFTMAVIRSIKEQVGWPQGACAKTAASPHVMPWATPSGPGDLQQIRSEKNRAEIGPSLVNIGPMLASGAPSWSNLGGAWASSAQC